VIHTPGAGGGELRAKPSPASPSSDDPLCLRSRFGRPGSVADSTVDDADETKGQADRRLARDHDAGGPPWPADVSRLPL